MTVYSYLVLFVDKWESMFKSEMEERLQEEHMKMRLGYNPFTFKSGTESVKFSQGKNIFFDT